MSSESNPCYKESLESAECLDQNNYDKTKCQMQFDNYKICKRFWGNMKTYRRRHGIYPILPEESEREKIKAEFLSGSKKF